MLMKEHYGISHWPDEKAIYEKMDRLVKEPLHHIKPAAMERYLSYFHEKCQGSRSMIEEAKKVIPGGVQHNLAFNYPFPLVITKAEGAYLYDIDGNRYVDYLQAGGPTLLGSNYAPVNEKVWEVVRESGPVTGLFHPYEMKLAEKIQDSMAKRLDQENCRSPKANNSYYLLKNTSTPTVIVECGFLSNHEEAELLATEAYQEKTAWAIHMGIMQYLNEAGVRAR